MSNFCAGTCVSRGRAPSLPALLITELSSFRVPLSWAGGGEQGKGLRLRAAFGVCWVLGCSWCLDQG